jgi:hypothetical protein
MPWIDIAPVFVLGLVVLAGFALAEWQRTGGRPGAPLDDVYIHYQYARNLATGGGFGFNPGQPTSGSTSPLWVLLLSGAYWLSGTLPVPARLLSVTAYLGVGVATAVLGRQLLADRRAALLASVLTVLSGRLAWAGMSSMETTLFCLVSLLGILRHDAERARERPAFGSAVLFGLATLLRWLTWCRSLRLEENPRRSSSRSRGKSGDIVEPHQAAGGSAPWLVQEAVSVAIYVALIVPYPVLSYAWTGHLLPNTFRVVSGDVVYEPLRYVREFLELVLRDHLLLTALLPIGLVVLGRRHGRARPLFLAWAVGLPFASAWLAPRLRHHGRYVMPLVPLYVLLGVAGLVAVMGWFEKRMVRQAVLRAVQVGTTVLVLGIALWGTVRWADQFAWNVDNINKMHVALGHWVAENTSPNAVVAANDIGAIGYISGREVVDTVGLVTPEVIDVLSPWDWAWKRDAALCRYLSYRDPELVLLLPNWYRALAQNEQILTPVYAVELPNNTIAGGDRMVVYVPRWPYVRDPAMDRRVDASLGQEVGLLGFDRSPARLVPGSPVRLTLYWESVRATVAHYKVFVHLADEKERIWGQHDAYPVEAMAPTFLWKAGDVVRDEHVFALAPDVQPGRLRLMVGMYDETTMERLPVVRGPDAGGGRVLLTELEIGD